MNHQISAGTAHRLGAQFDGDGTNFAVFSENAQRIDLCLFSDDGRRELSRIALPERTGPVWHGHVAGVKPGGLYGYRAHGSYAPDQGHRFNPHKLLLDPYTREMSGAWRNHSALHGFDQSSPTLDLSYDTRDSAPYVAKSVVSDPAHFATMARLEPRERADMLIYEAHVKGLTQEHPDVGAHVRGTYDGLASDAIIDHLLGLGVTSIELLPVHSMLNDAFLIERGLVNYWGYNSVGFFAPEPRYFGPAGLSGFRAMVDRFHAAGIEVILDVVYNHTAEGDHRGPTLCYRGLDNASYYCLIDGQPRYYANDTGTGNTVNVAHPFVLRMVLDSLRFWVECMGVDGFRFDLATTLGREDYGFDRRGGFFDALRQDPILSGVHLIAEPWDIGPGGYQLGRFPHEFGEWNDRFRDTTRRYWRGDDHSAQELAACLLGSASHFDKGGRRAWSSVNFVASHDGFTLADVSSYTERHNEANKENGADGHHANFGDNFGVEGETDDAAINAQRRRRRYNLLATLFLSQGTPMLLAGDEIANSQGGNNNAYCQDNPIGWVNWEKSDHELLEFTRQLSEFRRAHPCLHQSRFLHGAVRERDGLADVEWVDLDGGPLQWRDPGLSFFGLIIRGSAEAPDYASSNDAVFVVFNRDSDDTRLTLPETPTGRRWVCVLNTAAEGCFDVREVDPTKATAPGQSVLAFALNSHGGLAA